MPAMRSADGGDVGRMAGGRKPIVNGCPNGAALYRRLTGTVMAGDEQDQAVAAVDRMVERPVDGPPRAIQAHPVKVDDPVGLHRAAAEPPVPGAVEGRAAPAGLDRWLNRAYRSERSTW